MKLSHLTLTVLCLSIMTFGQSDFDKFEKLEFEDTIAFVFDVDFELANGKMDIIISNPPNQDQLLETDFFLKEKKFHSKKY